MKSESSKIHFKLIVILVLCLGVILNAQTPNDVRDLSPTQAIEREMTGAETHSYKIQLKADEFFQVRIEQTGVDVGLKLEIR